jgi:hypothetical protein
LVWPVTLIMVVKTSVANRKQDSKGTDMEFTVSKEDLLEKLAIEQIEAREMVDGDSDKPFEYK